MDRRHFIRMLAATPLLTKAIEAANRQKQEVFKSLPSAFLDFFNEKSIERTEIDEQKLYDLYIDWLKNTSEFKERLSQANPNYIISAVAKYRDEYAFNHPANQQFIQENPGVSISQCPHQLELPQKSHHPVNLIARVMLSEESLVEHKENLFIAGLIGQSVINRQLNMQAAGYHGWLSKVITGWEGAGYGIQNGKRPYASNINPLSKSYENNDTVQTARILSYMILNGRLSKNLNFGQVNFMHIKTQLKLHHKNSIKNRHPDIVHQDWISNGLLEIIIPNIDRDYIRFYIDTTSPYFKASLKDLENNRSFIMPSIDSFKNIICQK